MKELPALAILYCKDMADVEAYEKKSNEFFLNNPQNEYFLYSKWETNIKSCFLHKKTY